MVLKISAGFRIIILEKWYIYHSSMALIRGQLFGGFSNNYSIRLANFCKYIFLNEKCFSYTGLFDLATFERSAKTVTN